MAKHLADFACLRPLLNWLPIFRTKHDSIQRQLREKSEREETFTDIETSANYYLVFTL